MIALDETTRSLWCVLIAMQSSQSRDVRASFWRLVASELRDPFLAGYAFAVLVDAELSSASADTELLWN